MRWAVCSPCHCPIPSRAALTGVWRADKWLAQTPQMFRLGALEQAIVQAQAQGLQITDEASAMEASGHRPLLVTGSAHNFKITYPSDFALAQAVLQARRPSPEEVRP